MCRNKLVIIKMLDSGWNQLWFRLNLKLHMEMPLKRSKIDGKMLCNHGGISKVIQMITTTQRRVMLMVTMLELIKIQISKLRMLLITIKNQLLPQIETAIKELKEKKEKKVKKEGKEEIKFHSQRKFLSYNHSAI